MREKNNHLRIWVEIDTAALRHNLFELQKLIGPRVKFLAVVKSNAYGHGLVQVAKQLAGLGIKNNELRNSNHNSKLPVAEASLRYPSSRAELTAGHSGAGIIHSSRLWFGVDSFIEGARLREEGIANPILVLGSTLPGLFNEASRQNIQLSISNFESLKTLVALKEQPAIHLKIDTGMHRQGFLAHQVSELVRFIKRFSLAPAGIYTHFAAAKDRAYPTSTLEQFSKFKNVIKQFERAGIRKMIKHAAASGGTILFPETHLNMVRIGMALWGYWPSDEARINVTSGKFVLRNISLRPILSWKTRISEVKTIPTGSFVGYDLTERVGRKSIIAVLPIGYWHGFDRGLSSLGQVLIKGQRAKVLGRVSMDMTVCDITDIPGVGVGDIAVIIGKQDRKEISASDIARALGTSPYEVLTRINPLIERVYI